MTAPDRAAIMAEVRASIARISRAAAEPGVFVLPVVRDASAHRRQLDAIAEARARRVPRGSNDT